MVCAVGGKVLSVTKADRKGGKCATSEKEVRHQSGARPDHQELLSLISNVVEGLRGD